MVVFTRYFIALNRASLALTHATSNFIPASKVLSALYFPSFYRCYVTNFYVLNYVIEGDERDGRVFAVPCEALQLTAA